MADNITERVQNFYEKPEGENIHQLLDLIEKIVEEQLEIFEFEEKKVTDEIAWHHRDLHTLLKHGKKSLEKIKEELKVLGKIEGDPEKEGKVAELYEDIFHNEGVIDLNLYVMLMSTCSILRSFAKYYEDREKLILVFDKLGEVLEGKLPDREVVNELKEIKRKDRVVKEAIGEVITSLGKSTHKIVPQGDLIEAIKKLRDVLQIEGTDKLAYASKHGTRKATEAEG